MLETEISYIAGIFDGEGCVFISKSNPSISRRCKTPTYQLNSVVCNTYLPVLVWLKDNFGGTINQKVPPKDKNWSPSWSWQTNSNKALNFLETIYPFLRIKKLEVEIAISFQKIKINKKLIPHKLTKSVEDINLYEDFRNRIKNLKSRNTIIKN